MQKTVFGALVLILLLGLTGYSLAQRGSGHGPQMMRQGQMGPQGQQEPGVGMVGPMGPGMGGWGQMGPGMWGPGMMGQGMIGPGMGMMGSGMMGMMGPGMGMMGSPEILGFMMSIRGEIMSLIGQMMQRYGIAIWQMTPEIQQKMNREMLVGLGYILTKHGAALKERAEAVGK